MQHSIKQLSFRSLLPFVGPESVRKQLTGSSNLFANFVFFEIPRINIQEMPKRNPSVSLFAGTGAEVARAGKD